MPTYKSVLITQAGPPSVLQIIEQPLRLPGPDEVRIKILYTGVGFTDVIMRYGKYRLAPPPPLVPGYEIVGVVDALGEGVSGVRVGQRVAALTVHDGYAEYIYLAPRQLVPVPDGLDATEAVGLILNYVTAYQMLHRSARVQAGQTVLFTGASGGVGNALLQLGHLAGLKMYGTASKAKHDLVAELGGLPIDYRTDWVREVHAKEPNGLEAAFDGLGVGSATKAYGLLRRGGTLVAYGVTVNIKDGNSISELASYVVPSLLNLWPDGKHSSFYGITVLYGKDPKPFHEDLPKVFQLLAERKIKPLIADVLPLEQAARAHELLEAGSVRGKLLLKCSPD